jgi:hypothetical protein
MLLLHSYYYSSQVLHVLPSLEYRVSSFLFICFILQCYYLLYSSLCFIPLFYSYVYALSSWMRLNCTLPSLPSSSMHFFYTLVFYQNCIQNFLSNTIPCHALSCHAMHFHSMPCLTMPCPSLPFIPCHVIPYIALPFHSMPCYTLHRLAFTFHAMPCISFPFHAMPFISLPCCYHRKMAHYNYVQCMKKQVTQTQHTTNIHGRITLSLEIK